MSAVGGLLQTLPEAKWVNIAYDKVPSMQGKIMGVNIDTGKECFEDEPTIYSTEAGAAGAILRFALRPKVAGKPTSHAVRPVELEVAGLHS